MSKHVILTGLRTNAEYHLGNYLGGILPMVALQHEHSATHSIHMFAPDLHSFTTPIDHAQLYQQTMNNLRVFVAAGMPVNHDNFFLYRQSYVPAHSELTVLLNNFTYFGELSRMTQFKEKGAQEQNVTAGLFDYPVLMAADILLYGATWVPVGEDQQQHLELARDIAQRMNNKFGDLFIIPEAWKDQLVFAHRLEGVRIRSLRNPHKKMSKSVEDPSGTIKLTDTPDEAAKKIMRAETDTLGSVQWDWQNQPGITNLLQIYELLSGTAHDDVMKQWAGNTQYGELKKAVAMQVQLFLSQFQKDYASVDMDAVNEKLITSERVVNTIANERLHAVQQAVGLRPQQ